MPYIIRASPDDLDRGAGAAVAGLGRNVRELGERISQTKLMREREQRMAAEESRRLDIAEVNAKRQLLAEANRAKALGARADSEAAEMQGAQQEFMGAQGKNQAQAFRGGLKEGLRSSGGVLGPFGMLNPRALAHGAKASMESQQRMAGKLELAKRMDPGTARGYLERAANDERATIQQAGYERESKALSDAVEEGRLSEEEAKPLIEELQAAIADGGDPGQIEQRIARAYDLHAKSLTRAQDWEEADKTAAGMLDGLRQLAAGVQDGEDPETGKSLKAELAERLGQAKVEWNRTKEGPAGTNKFRAETDPQGSLAGLQRILFEAQAEADPDLFLAEDEQEERGRRIPAPTRRQTVGMGIEDPLPATGARVGSRTTTGATSRQASQDRSGARQARGGSNAQQRTQLQAVVRDGAQAALRAGSQAERRAAMKALLQRVADDLGLDPTSQEVRAIVQEELQGAWGPR